MSTAVLYGSFGYKLYRHVRWAMRSDKSPEDKLKEIEKALHEYSF